MELYLHLPFCVSKCRYCDFASWAGHENQMPAYIHAMLEEGRQRSAQLSPDSMETVFIGGGTPSVVPPALLDHLLSGLRQLLPWRKDAEFTVEANPGTLTAEWLNVAVQHGVNRISLGMQASQPSLLHTLGRIHTQEHVCQSVRMARESGIENLNLDLMFGLPGQTLQMWKETLQSALALAPDHISCYGLIPEEGTPLLADLQSGRLTLPEEDVERQMYDTAIRILSDHGFEQYEISNFALPGRACRHNLGYWRQIPYLGLGASAASLLPGDNDEIFCLRETNPREIDAYISMMTHASDRREKERVSKAEARFETMMLGLRTTQGVNEQAFWQMHGVTLDACCGDTLAALSQRRLLQYHQGWWSLTRRGMDIQNSVLVELMEVMLP